MSLVKKLVLGLVAVSLLIVGGCSASIVRGFRAGEQLPPIVSARLADDAKLAEAIGGGAHVETFGRNQTLLEGTTLRIRFYGTVKGEKGVARFGGIATSFGGLPWLVDVEWTTKTEAEETAELLKPFDALFKPRR